MKFFKKRSVAWAVLVLAVAASVCIGFARKDHFLAKQPTELLDVQYSQWICDDAKLLSKGVKSVRQHIALLKDYTSLSIDEFKRFVRENLCDGEICLTHSDVAAVERIMQEYLTDEFIYGNNPRYTLVRKHRFEGVGDFEVRLQLKNNVIRDLDLKGDYFLVGDLDRDLLCHLHGVTLDAPSLRAVLSTLSLSSVIHNMDAEMFLRLLLDE